MRLPKSAVPAAPRAPEEAPETEVLGVPMSSTLCDRRIFQTVSVVDDDIDDEAKRLVLRDGVGKAVVDTMPTLARSLNLT